MAKKPGSPIKRVAPKPKYVKIDVDPENDNRYLTTTETVTMPMADAAAVDAEFTVSPFRALLADRPRKPQSHEHVPTEKTRRGVIYAHGLGISQEAIARIMGINVKTLIHHYEDNLFAARHMMMNDIQTNLYNIARDPNHKGTVQAGIYLLSNLGGEAYRPSKKVELSGPDGRPLQIDQRTQTVDPRMLTVEQRDALREIMTSALKLTQSSDAPSESEPIDGEYKEVD
jgi:hypothetical protein